MNLLQVLSLSLALRWIVSLTAAGQTPQQGSSTKETEPPAPHNSRACQLHSGITHPTRSPVLDLQSRLRRSVSAHADEFFITTPRQ